MGTEISKYIMNIVEKESGRYTLRTLTTKLMKLSSELGLENPDEMEIMSHVKRELEKGKIYSGELSGRLYY